MKSVKESRLDAIERNDVHSTIDVKFECVAGSGQHLERAIVRRHKRRSDMVPSHEDVGGSGNMGANEHQSARWNAGHHRM